MKKHTLQRRLIVYFLLVAILPAILILGYFFQTTQRQTQNWLMEDRQQQLEHSMELIELRVQQVNEFSSWLEKNDVLQHLLALPEEEASQYTEDHYSFKKELRTQVYASSMAHNLLSLFIIGENGLDIRSGAEAALVDFDALLALAQPSQVMQNDLYMRMNNLTEFSSDKQVIVYTRRLLSQENGQTGGVLVLLLSTNTFSDVIANIGDPEEYQIMLRNSSGRILAVKGQMQQGNTLEIQTESLITGWTMCAKISTDILARQKDSLVQSAILLIGISLVVIAVFSVYLSYDFAQPIERVVDTVDHIAQGDFRHVENVRCNNEIARLSRHIDRMGDNIQKMMLERIAHEQEKRHMEMKMLQSQMNPHFLYNTLSSIKLMANMQGKAGIGRMIEMLGRLLRANMAIETELIPLRQELELVDSYVYLQNIRLNGKLEYNREDVPEELMQVPVLKFLLQPLVENAIIHGLAPQIRKGILAVSARRIGQDLVIAIQDNGIGMNEEQLERARQTLCGQLHELEEDGKDGNGIALGNVLARLRLQFGSDCDIVVHSIQNEGTTVVVRMPVTNEEAGDA